MLRTAALDYDLPQDRIATHPAVPRDSARLLVVRRERPDACQHLAVRDLPDLLSPGDRMVFNATRVLPARFLGVREDTGGHVQGLYLEGPSGPGGADGGLWIAMIKSRRHKAGARIRVLAGARPSPYSLRMLRPVEDPPGAWLLELACDEGPAPAAPAVLEAIGLTPLPPYILAARRAEHDEGDDTADREQYQTVYAETGRAASVAAPTAGLHFTPALLDRLGEVGVSRTDVVLHVGAGTFKPVETETVEEHPIHAEWCSMSPEAVGEVERTRRERGRVVAVGTTSVRTLESYAMLPVGDRPDHLSTRLLITPGFDFRWTDTVLTNFHLPRSTLMALVAAKLQDPREPPGPDGAPPGVSRLKGIYAEAAARGYRFYSFGDAMLIL